MAVTQKALLASVPTDLFIGGTWRPSASRDRFDVHDPATGAVRASVADGAVDDGRAALDAAVGAQDAWAATAPRERGEVLRAAYELMHERSEELAMLMTLEMGKPLAEARGEVVYAAEFFRWFSEEAVRIHGRYAVAPNGATRLLTMKQPVGPTLMITPWNFPLAMGTRKIGPALAAGCTMVVKPAHETPLSMLALARLLEDVGVPGGVVNVITTTRSGAVCEPLITDARLRKLTFTGSTAVGKVLVRQSAEQLLRLSMELGGNAPFVVFADADLDKAVEGAMLAKFRNIGQACTAANRFIVQESVAAEFARRLTERVGAMKIGRGTETGVTIGPLVSDAAVAGTDALVQDALAHGATLLAGGKRPEGPGSFYEPTVLTNVAPASAILTEEIFGPVVGIVTFADEAEAVRLANSTEYGLISYVFTQDLARGQRMIAKLETGMMGLNTGLVSNAAAPFGGVKQSGMGREGGLEGIQEYLSTKYTLIPVS
ncbi:MAG TPA: NAD-dependent succinate-semialdehyde dehydrogenase [Cryobacterium sp.]|nr:NAD-dependent succinate-semialdehyde dehydrogenase [Cryobacterium sp.]